MNAFFAQIIVAQRNVDGEGWINILVVIVMAAIWMIGGILKAKKGRPDEQQRQARRPPAPGRDPMQQPQHPAGPAQRLPATQQVRTKLGDLRAAAKKFVAEAEQAFQVQTTEPKTKPQHSASKQQIQPEPAEGRDLTGTTVKGLAGKRDTSTAATPEAQHLPELLQDYADPDNLRRAILHYEILGKPLSLRDM
ncbi:MAG: hypothetical protein CEE38_09320 [Planctomycetes bacterium B3_Pla]|nr:MAG: hypothetical protein CEE38_09320 [Planctomycetes bacterium B3_Pla]